VWALQLFILSLALALTDIPTHLDKVLLVTESIGWTHCEGKSKTEIRPGYLIWCNCGKKHWHGATANSSMEHVAVQEALNGKPIDWFEEVTDDVYLAGQP